jgi:hypothetical protein
VDVGVGWQPARTQRGGRSRLAADRPAAQLGCLQVCDKPQDHKLSAVAEKVQRIDRKPVFWSRFCCVISSDGAPLSILQQDVENMT